MRSRHSPGCAATGGIGVLTNCDDDLFALTRARHPFLSDLVVTAQSVGSYKPSPGHFTEFQRRTGARLEDWVHASVSWRADVEPAAALGVRCVWVDRERTGEDASIAAAHIATVAELPDAVASLG